MGQPGAAEYLVIANHFIQKARSSINNVNEDESAAVSSLQNLCNCFENLGKARDIDSSIQYQGISIQDTLSDGLMAVAITLQMGFNNPIAAIACLEAAIAVNKQAAYHFMAGQIYYQVGVKQNAFENLKAAVELDPQNEDYTSALNQLLQEKG